jgi:hypothetical protein
MFPGDLLELGAVSPALLGQALSATIVCAFVLTFVVLFAWKLGIFTRTEIQDWARAIKSQIRSARAFVGKTTRAPPQTFIYAPDGEGADAHAVGRNFVIWSKAFPIEKRVFEEFDALLRSSTPTQFLLLSTDPPTLKMTRWGPAPIVTALYQVEDLEKFPEYYTRVPKSVVATAHNHLKGATIVDHDIEIFEKIDRLVGKKVHVIGTRSERRMYCAADGPVFTGQAAAGGE